jgi:16S rRNA (cytosine1402-N4)-methyltransferase
MLAETLAYLDIKASGVYVDLTIGPAGHSLRILEQLGPQGFLLGVDRDPEALKLAEQRLRPCAGRFRLLPGRFSDLESLLAEAGISELDGVLMDTGISRDQLLDPARGFSFASSGLSMKLNPAEPGPDAAEIVNTYSVAQLKQVFSIVGKGREAGRAARAIATYREGRKAIESTAELAQIIAAAVARPGSWGKNRHPATPWLMAIRVAANDELAEIEGGLRAAARSLRPGSGRLVVVSWAGHEHGLVRQTLRNLQQPCSCPPALPCTCQQRPLLRVLTRKPLAASEAEIHRNPATRTCRLQAAVATSLEDRA